MLINVSRYSNNNLLPLTPLYPLTFSKYISIVLAEKLLFLSVTLFPLFTSVDTPFSIFSALFDWLEILLLLLVFELELLSVIFLALVK